MDSDFLFGIFKIAQLNFCYYFGEEKYKCLIHKHHQRKVGFIYAKIKFPKDEYRT
jgi:hypothetical protein